VPQLFTYDTADIHRTG